MQGSLNKAKRLSRVFPAEIVQLVDENWYLKQNPDVHAAGLSAVDHYMSLGWAEGRNPNPLFDTEWYFQQYPDVEASGADPLTHYVQKGWLERRDPHPAFDTSWYLEEYGDVKDAGVNPLIHYLHVGHGEGRKSQPDSEPSSADLASADLTKIAETGPPDTPAEIALDLDFPAEEKFPAKRNCFFDLTATMHADEVIQQIRQRAPDDVSQAQVTVVVPVYKNLRYTLRCVLSVICSADTTARKILIVDDKSPDGSGLWLQERLQGLAAVEVVINETNLGFLRSCNAAIKQVETEFVFLLNNDTFVIDGWLDELYGVFQRHPDCGLAGSKLLYPDGTLQEAGGIIWKDASGANFGRNQDPWKPEFNYQRDVDYISGAAIMTPMKVWQALEGFSDEFAPAYYEDTDYAMKVRKLGYRVIYQPLSSVIHFEGASSGTDITKGVKRYQAINRETFETKWAAELAKAGEPADFSKHIVDRKPRGRIMIYDNETPRPDKDSGSITAFQYMKILTELGMRVTFVPQNLLWTNKHSRALQRLGVEVIFAPYQTVSRDYVLNHAGEFDIVMLSRAPIGGHLINDIKARYPDLPIIFDTVDVHHLRMFRQYDLELDWSLWEAAAEMKRIELNAIRKANITLLVSQNEVAHLHNEIGPFPHAVLPLIYEEYSPKTPYSRRRDVAFIGGFRHTPNADAVEYLVNEIWPIFRQRKTGAKLHIIGSHMPKDFCRFACDDIIPVGYVEDLESYMENIRVSVAPLRYGAGVKGKVGNSLRMGVPVVGTPVAFEGMGLKDEIHVKAGSTSEELAAAIFEVYRSEERWSRLANTGRNYVMKSFGTEAATQTLKAVVNSLLR